MKSILLASALMIGGVAFAQTEQPTTPPAPPATTEPAPAPAPASPETMTPPAGSTMQPGDTMAPPPASTTTTGSGTIVTQEGGNMTAPPADTGPYPRCSRTVTDHCQQSSARESDTKGGPPAHRRHKRR